MASDKIRRRTRSALLSDATAVIGAASIVYGVYQLSEPAAWILGGSLMMAGGILAALARKDPD